MNTDALRQGWPFGRLRTAARLALCALLVGLLVVAAASCGASTPPGEAAPGLRTALSEVETAVAAKKYNTAREAATELVRQADTALHAGHITADQAQRIQAAVARLVADLPAPDVTPSTPVAPSAHATVKPEHPKPKKSDQGHGKPKPDKKH